jgi:hypothetical protein
MVRYVTHAGAKASGAAVQHDATGPEQVLDGVGSQGEGESAGGALVPRQRA